VTDDPDQASGGVAPAAPRGGWSVPFLLLGAVLVTATFRFDVLIGVPFIALVLFLRVERRWSILIAAAFAWLVATGASGDGLWWVERAWTVVVAGWFVALTLRWPDTAFLRRGLGAIVGAVGVFGFAFTARPGAWAAIDWRVAERIRLTIAAATAEFSARLEEPLAADTREAITEWVGAQIELFPAMLALGTLASLGLAWWMYGRWARGWASPLGRLREFRFSDHLVWVLIGGLALTLFGLGEGWERAGSNTVVFMGALYVLRGVGVILFASGGLSFFGGIVFAVAVLLLAPIVIAGTLVIGVGDTWLDLRTKLRERTSG
jgi:hypothetical protein